MLRYLLGCHSKTPLEFFFLESGSIPIRYVISSRRINYLRTILRREEEELTQRVFEAQIANPCTGDFAELVKHDLESIGLGYDPSLIRNTDEEVFKKLIKQKITAAAFSYLSGLQNTHSKVRDIVYDRLEIQPYLVSTMFTNQETTLLSSLRSRTHDAFKKNFSQMYGGHVQCPLKCSDPDEPEWLDSQEHLLQCIKIKELFHSTDVTSHSVKYSDILGNNVKKLKELATIFTTLLEIKKELSEKEEPGILDPCIGNNNQCNGDAIFTPVFHCMSIGN